MHGSVARTVATRGPRAGLAIEGGADALGGAYACNASLWNGAANGRVDSQRWIHP